jgi:uncharacterized membrane-anchored protein
MNKRTALAVFAAAVAVQVLILVGVPLQKVLTRATGRPVFLKVVPVDPYNILSGYYVTLAYEISRVTSFPDAPAIEEGATLFAVVEEGSDGLWHPVSLETTRPANLPINRIAIKGRVEGSRIVYGLEEFFIPEEQRGVIADELGKYINETRVELKVDEQGQAALIRLHIKDHVYE